MINHAYIELFEDSSAHKELDIAYGEDKHITNSKIRQESMKIVEGISNSNELKFGTLVSSSFDIQLAIDTDNLTNTDIEVSVAVNHDTENVLKIGKYKVISDKPTADRLYKNIKAYDGLYEVINADVSDWYESLTFPMTLKAFRDSFFTEVGIEQVEATLVNDDMNIEKTISTNSLSGRQVLSAICELNGAFGRINREGKFAYVFLEVNPTDRIEISNYASGVGGYEDFETTPISKVQIRQETNDIGATVGEGTNGYVVEDNFLVYGKSTEDLTTIATNLLSIIEGITYRPYTGIKTLGNPCYEVGDAVTIPTRNATINSYILNRTLTGIQALRDTYKAEGVEVYTQKVNSFDNEVKQLKRQTNTLSRTVEETKSTITSIETVAEEANQNAQTALDNVGTAYDKATEALDKTNGFDERITKNESSITQQAEEIESKVSKEKYTGEDIASLINQTAESIKILAQHLKLEGLTTINDNFQVLEDGSVVIKGGRVNIDAESQNDDVIALNYASDYASYISAMRPYSFEAEQYVQSTGASYTSKLQSSGMTSGYSQDGVNFNNASVSAHSIELGKTTNTDAGTISQTYFRANENGIVAKSVKTAAGVDLDTLALKNYDVALRTNVSNAGLKKATISGKIAVLSMLVTTTVAISGWTVIGVLPEGVRPTNIFYGVGFVQYTNACGVAISADGQISVQPVSTVPIGYNIFINFSYPIA